MTGQGPNCPWARVRQASRLSLENDDRRDAWLSALEKILEAVVENDDHKLGAIPLATEVPVAIGNANNTQSGYSYHNVVEAFERSAESYPDDTAIVSGGRRLSYSEACHQRNLLLAALSSAGVGSGDVVGVCVTRTEWLAIAPLAVMRSESTFISRNRRS